MYFTPRTLAEAQAHRYNEWAGNSRGTAFDPTRCAAEIAVGGRSCLFKQCSKKPGHGHALLYCKQHARKLSERDARRAEREEE